MQPEQTPRRCPIVLIEFVSQVRPDWSSDDISGVVCGALARGWPWPRIALALVRLAFDSEMDHPRRLLDAPELRPWRQPDLYGIERAPADPNSVHHHAERIRRRLPGQRGDDPDASDPHTH